MIGMIEEIKRIERSSYPACYRQMQECSTMDDIVEYCEARDQDDLVIMTGTSWYFIAVRSTGEIVDLAGKLVDIRDLFAIKRKIIDVFAGKVISLDARESTSYRLVTAMSRRVGTIVEDEEYSWEGETFHEIKLHIFKRKRA